MKRNILFALLLAGIGMPQSQAQTLVPPYFSYQAVARDGNGVLANASLDVRASIFEGGPNGQEIYAEEFLNVQTNLFGLFHLGIGSGSVLTGTTLGEIDWSGSNYWMRIGFKPPGGNDFLLLNATQLLSVPYALFAEKARNAGPWLDNPDGIHYGTEGGNVGIGTNSPENKLMVRGVDSNDEENLANFRKDNAAGASRNFFVRMRPSVPEVLLTTDGTGGQPRLTLGPAGAVYSFLTITPGENSGINTNNPEAGLDILRSNGAPALRVTKSAGQEPVAVFRRDPDPAFQPVMAITRDGFVGINTGNPGEALHVVGNICYTGNLANCSDSRYKRDLQPLAGALGKITQLQGRYFYWNQEDFPGKNFSGDRQIGLIAQELEQQFPELVFTDSEGYKSVDYARLSVVLIEAVREQQAQIEELKAEVKKNDQLEGRLSRLESLLYQDNQGQAARFLP